MNLDNFAYMILNTSLFFQIAFLIFMYLYKKTSNYNWFSLIFIFALSLQIAHYLFYTNIISFLMASLYVGLYSILFCANFTLNIIFNKILWDKLNIINDWVKKIKGGFNGNN